MSLLMLKAFIPGKFTGVTAIICSKGQYGIPNVDEVATSTRQLRSDLLRWHRRYEALMKTITNIPLGSAEYDSHCKVYATYLCCMIITTRLLSAISAIERPYLEESASVHAERMFRLEEEVRDVSVQTTLFLAQTLGVSHSIKITTGDWVLGNSPGSISSGSENSECFDDANGIIARWKFEAWNRVCGRKLPS